MPQEVGRMFPKLQRTMTLPKVSITKMIEIIIMVVDGTRKRKPRVKTHRDNLVPQWMQSSYAILDKMLRNLHPTTVGLGTSVTSAMIFENI